MYRPRACLKRENGLGETLTFRGMVSTLILHCSRCESLCSSSTTRLDSRPPGDRPAARRPARRRRRRDRPFQSPGGGPALGRSHTPRLPDAAIPCLPGLELVCTFMLSPPFSGPSHTPGPPPDAGRRRPGARPLRGRGSAHQAGQARRQGRPAAGPGVGLGVALLVGPDRLDRRQEILRRRPYSSTVRD
jgi:hypothetical protein